VSFSIRPRTAALLDAVILHETKWSSLGWNDAT